MTRKKIHVTAEDIANGVREASKACPIALALHRETGLDAINVLSKWKSLTHPMMAYIDLPRSALIFMERFDEGMAVNPFNFFTDVPDAS